MRSRVEHHVIETEEGLEAFAELIRKGFMEDSLLSVYYPDKAHINQMIRIGDISSVIFTKRKEENKRD